MADFGETGSPILAWIASRCSSNWTGRARLVVEVPLVAGRAL